jgi:nitrile hydratase
MTEPPRFAAGAAVLVRNVDPVHHSRVPRYIRGHRGVVVEAQGAWPVADDRAQNLPRPRVEPVYTVRFAARELWGTGGHWVTVDVWQSNLEPATEADG